MIKTRIEGNVHYTQDEQPRRSGFDRPQQMSGLGDVRKDAARKNNDNRAAIQQIASARRQIPRTAAVTITRGENGPSYVEIMRSARNSVSLIDMGIKGTKTRRAANGGLVIELPGNEMTEKANELVR